LRKLTDKTKESLQISIQGADGTWRIHETLPDKPNVASCLQIGDTLPFDFKQFLREVPKHNVTLRRPIDPLEGPHTHACVLETVTEELSERYHPQLQVTTQDASIVESIAFQLQMRDNSAISAGDPFVLERLSLLTVEKWFRCEKKGIPLTCQCQTCVCQCTDILWKRYFLGENASLQCTTCLCKHPGDPPLVTTAELDRAQALENRKTAIRYRVTRLHPPQNYLEDPAALDISREIQAYDDEIEQMYFQFSCVRYVPATWLNVKTSDWFLDLGNSAVMKTVQEYIDRRVPSATDDVVAMQCSFGLAMELSKIHNSTRLVSHKIHQLKGVIKGKGKVDPDPKAIDHVMELLHDVAVAYWTAYYHVYSPQQRTHANFDMITPAERLKVYSGNYIAKAIANGAALSKVEWEFIDVFVHKTRMGGWHFIDELLGHSVHVERALDALAPISLAESSDAASEIVSSGSFSNISEATVSSYVTITSVVSKWSLQDDWNLVYADSQSEYDRQIAADTTNRLFRAGRSR